jgi:hypothetical protein
MPTLYVYLRLSLSQRTKPCAATVAARGHKCLLSTNDSTSSVAFALVRFVRASHTLVRLPTIRQPGTRDPTVDQAHPI